MSDVITNEELKILIRKLVPKVNLTKTGIKSFTKLLSKECGGIDLKKRSDFIKETLSEAINDMDDDDEEDEEEKEEKPKKTGGAKGLSVKKEITPKLAAFLKQGGSMARTEIVKLLWQYIKKNELQNPENKREILLDDAMHEVFEVRTFTMFTMNKYIAAHIDPYKPVDLTPKPKSDTPKKRKRKSSKDGPPEKKKRKAKKAGLQPPYRLSKALVSVVGKEILPRPQVVTALWEYIKKNGLQVCIAGTRYCAFLQSCLGLSF
jgi:upstream activation factor subunit UAF30